MSRKTLIFGVILVFLTTICEGNKYGESLNKDSEAPFKMMKVNLVWQKAKMRLSDKPTISALYQELKHQDQLESDLKQRKALNEDEDGEFEALVRRKFLDLVTKYGIEGIHPDVPGARNNEAFINKAKPEKQAKWERVLQDKKLAKLWKKAQMAGFTEKELGALRAELLHHLDKVEELSVLQSDLETNGMRDNSVHSLKDKVDAATLRQERERHIEMKKKYKELRDNIEGLEEKVYNQKAFDETAAGGFRHPKVIDLWFNAKSSNFTDDELKSIQEELSHFEHKLKKLETLEMEHETLTDRLADKNRQLGTHPEKHLKVAEKVKDYGKRVKKYEHEIKSRIDQGTRHNEL